MFTLSKLKWLLLLYCATSLFHFAHNGLFIEFYPNMPPWITQDGVYGSWIAITCIGLVGYLFFKKDYRFFGYLFTTVYAVFGLDGLGHYYLAPVSQHTLMMNLSIMLEVTAASFVLLFMGLMVLTKNTIKL